MMATKGGHAAVVELLLQSDANVNLQTSVSSLRLFEMLPLTLCRFRSGMIPL